MPFPSLLLARRACLLPSPSILLRSPSSGAATAAKYTSVAKLTLVGTLGAEPQIKTLDSGAEIVSYPVATQSGPASEPYTSWWRIQCYAPADALRDRMMAMTKGSLLYVEAEGSIRKVDREDRPLFLHTYYQKKVEVLRKGGSGSETSTENHPVQDNGTAEPENVP